MSDVVPARQAFLPDGVLLDHPGAIEPLYRALHDRVIPDRPALEQWLLDWSDLEAALSEEGAWRYIRMTQDTRDKEAGERYERFTLEVQPLVDTWTDRLNRKLVAVPFADELREGGYPVMLRGIREQLRIFREENVAIQAGLRKLAQDYSTMIGAMTIPWNGEEITLPKAAALLEEKGRTVRERAFRGIASRRMQDRDRLDDLFDAMVRDRHRMAVNAGFANYRDYAYAALGRFDHGPADAEAFHASVAEVVVPLIEELEQERQQSLGVDRLRPWDLAVDSAGLSPLRPFRTGQELLVTATAIFEKVHPSFAAHLRAMGDKNLLDLESREGKAPGGYNYPLYRSGAPFIFMNAVGTADDLVTMLHEGGHAVHSFRTHALPLTAFKQFPSEVAELASMGMELLSMRHWDLAYPDPKDLQRAQRDQLERVIGVLPWVATVDAFQHWVYTHPDHDRVQRAEAWTRIHERFSGRVVDWTGLEEERASFWHKQLHIFEVPFYYIEYGIAQLGAIGLWAQAEREPDAAVERYAKALSLGYTRTLPEIYAAAGVRFDLGKPAVTDLAGAVAQELRRLRGMN
ncbi:MAG: M3 family oligoendopeptidase [Flavobacteriales bacterium]|jgi:oligoendopeptidase F|nr:M3 family oligoendopeptidase [Flavobacteriales bacterium]MBK7268632.1 M3 family oligoendopeptidase [Flavobacteriales bacterium]MBK7752849.1 M3 family oligoendopeptidase [Flavobacteriales bacterium]MBK9076164.1 M3 family oligoendopeptidase [Flavobacteriales bacterium]MBP7515826.1 M3 family oligoendopeptidase [Flavobacteriales bacterium]